MLFASLGALFAQEALKSTEEEYYDFLALKGDVARPTLGYRTLSDSAWGEQSTNRFIGLPGDARLRLYGPDWFSSFNTAAPYGQNDGALWQGKGYNTSITAGVRLEAFGVEATLKPQFCFSQNLAYDIMPSAYPNSFGYMTAAGGYVDLPQRFGDAPFYTFDWGDSELRYTWRTFTIGFGTQSPWLGPAWLNPMLGSNNAPSYPKLDLGIRKTAVSIPGIDWYLGDIEGRIWTGMLTESAYFDNDPSNDRTMLNAVSMAFAPSILPGLTIGLNRVFLTKWDQENLAYIVRLFNTSKSNVKEDQKISFTADWLIPEGGVEVYGELGIDDYANTSTILDYLKYPFHTMDYTVGLKKAIALRPERDIHGEIVFEWNSFEMSQDFQLQWPYMGLYSHSILTHGYTNQGQIPGAGSGSMGNSQYLGFRVFYPKGNASFYVHRTNPDNNYVYSKAVYERAGVKTAETGTTLEMSYFSAFKATCAVGLSMEYAITPRLSISGGYAYEIIVNPLYQNGLHPVSNTKIQTEIRYRL